MSEETVVHRGCSRYGLHTLRVLRPGEPVDVERRLQEAREAGADEQRLVYRTWQEAELGVHYLQVWWREAGTEGYDGWMRQ